MLDQGGWGTLDGYNMVPALAGSGAMNTVAVAVSLTASGVGQAPYLP